MAAGPANGSWRSAGTARNLAAADQGAARHPVVRRAGPRHPARRARRAGRRRWRSASRRSAGSCAGIKPERGDIILAGARDDPDGARGRRLRRRRGHRGRPARGRVLLALARAPSELFDDVRRQSVLNLAGLYHVDHAHTEHVARLALGLFDELAAAGLHAGEPVERELLWAACVLHDIGMTRRLRRPSQALALPGPQRRPARLHAARGRAHRPGRALPPQGHAGLRPVRPADGARATTRCSPASRRCCAWPRTSSARATSSSAPRTPTSPTAACELRLVTEGDASVSRWAAARETELFAAAFDRELVVE